MANHLYFIDHADGASQQVKAVMFNDRASDQFGPKGWVGYNGTAYVPVRKVEYKSNPSKHVCDARCQHATGRTMKCECSCGGKNHGKG